MESLSDIRPSPIAGRWYPGNPTRLAESVDGYLQNAHLPPLDGEIVGVITPHAGHLYSGPVAGYAFATLRGLKPEIVAIVSPMHHPFFQVLLTSGHQAYQTPLGVIPIDLNAVKELNQRLITNLDYSLTPVRNDEEHSLEIELPFLQRALASEFKLLPVMVRENSVKVTQALGKALAQTLAGKTSLLVASTDLSHFYSQSEANRFDKEILRRLEAFDPQGVLRAEEEGKGFACGCGAVAAVLWAAREMGANQVKVLHYATSGDVTGDYNQVVGYGAAVILRIPTPGGD
jgi:AmmeMemoRadiSam system protein B